jgi:hypothetical protein
MIGPRNVQPDELGDADGMDVQDAMRVGNRLNEAMDEVPITTREGFSDRVMTALAGEPTPGTTGFLAPLRRRGFLAGLGESVRQAWASVGSGRPMLGRSAALAYVLAVLIAGISLAGAATVGTAGALGLFDPASTPSPAPTTPGPTAPPVTTAPPPSIPPTPSPSPNMSEPPDGPTPSPTQTDDGPEASDDHGGNSGPEVVATTIPALAATTTAPARAETPVRAADRGRTIRRPAPDRSQDPARMIRGGASAFRPGIASAFP